jgi:hypothetical protein
MRKLLFALLLAGMPAYAQFGSNATRLRGKPLCNPLTLTDTWVLNWNAAGSCYSLVAPSGGGGLAPIADQRILGNVSGGSAVPIGITAAQVATFLSGQFEVPLTFTPPMTRTTNTITCAVATGSVPGCLATADWTTFNGKQAALSGLTNNQFVYATGAGSLASHQYFLKSASFDSPVTKNSYGAQFYLHHTGSGPFYSLLQFDDSANSNGGSGATKVDFLSQAGNHLSFTDTGGGWSITGFISLVANTQASYTVTSFSATPTFTPNPNTVAGGFIITLTGNVTSSTLFTAQVSTGELLTFNICQDATGGRTFVWPTTVLGGGTISAAASACSRQTFVYDGTNALATGPMSLFTSGAVTLPESNLSTSDITTNNASTSKHGFVPKLPNDATKFYNGVGAFTVPAGGNASIPSVGNITAVTAAANSTSDQALQELALPAGWLNTLTQQTILNGSGILTIAVAQIPTLTFKVKLCTVSGCGSGTVLTLASMTTAATVASTNNPWNLTLVSGTSLAGASGTLITHGFLAVDIAASNVAPEVIQNDTNTAVSSAIDLTAALFVDFTVATSTGSTGNIFIQQNAGAMNPGGSPVSSVNTMTGAVSLADLNSTGQVTVTHLSAPLPVAQGGYNGTSLSLSTQTDGATITWAIASVALASARVTLAGNRTLNLTGLVNGGSYVLNIIQDGTGSRGLTLGSGCTWKVSGGGSGAITPSTAANAQDMLAFVYDGTNCYANFSKNFN